MNDKIKINKHVCNIDKKIGEYFTRNYVLNKRYFSVKSIILIFDIFKQNNSYKKWNSNSEPLSNSIYLIPKITESNIKQREKINDHSIMLNKHQDYIMDCIDYVKGLYKETEELKNNLIQKDKK